MISYDWIFIYGHLMAKKNREFDLATLSGRLGQVIDDYPSNVELAEKIGELPGYLNRLLNLQETTFSRAAKIAEATDTSMNWLAWGLGPRSCNEALNCDQESDFIKISPLVENQKLDVDFDFDFITSVLKASPIDCLAWEITDEAMTGKYEKGQTVLINKNYLAESGDYVVNINGVHTIRKIIHTMPGKCKVSSNTMGEVDLDLSKNSLESQIPIAGRIIWYGGKA